MPLRRWLNNHPPMLSNWFRQIIQGMSTSNCYCTRFQSYLQALPQNFIFLSSGPSQFINWIIYYCIQAPCHTVLQSCMSDFFFMTYYTVFKIVLSIFCSEIYQTCIIHTKAAFLLTVNKRGPFFLLSRYNWKQPTTSGPQEETKRLRRLSGTLLLIK